MLITTILGHINIATTKKLDFKSQFDLHQSYTQGGVSRRNYFCELPSPLIFIENTKHFCSKKNLNSPPKQPQHQAPLALLSPPGHQLCSSFPPVMAVFMRSPQAQPRTHKKHTLRQAVGDIAHKRIRASFMLALSTLVRPAREIS